MDQENKKSNADTFDRREVLKGLATVPVLGSVSYTHLTLPTICSV